jgi:hypothetical protein
MVFSGYTASFPSFTLLISNYSRRHPVESVLCAVQDAVQRRIGGRPNFLSHDVTSDDSVTVTLPNQMQVDNTLELNGALLLNYPIWIVKSPIPFANVAPVLSLVFYANASNGIVDLAQLPTKVAAAGGAKEMVRLNNRDFVEFLLFHLGREARDTPFWVHTLVLSDNNIQVIDPWSPFLHFLPNLRIIHAENNALTQRPELPEWPHLEIHWEPQRPRTAHQRR